MSCLNNWREVVEKSVLKRNNGLDELRFMAAICVCFQHTLNGNGLSGSILALSRIAVPIFFLISGFYFISDVKKIKRQIRKLFIIAVEMTVLYFAADIVINFLSHNLNSYFKETFTLKNLVRLFVFNDPFIADHAWYIFAAIYSIIVMYAITKIQSSYFIEVIICISLVVLLLCGKYSVLVFGKAIPSYITRSWFCVGVPFMAIGFRYKKALIDSKANMNLMLAIFFSIETLIECYILKGTGLGGSREVYIGTIMSSIFVFAFFLKKEENRWSKKIAEWGRRYSLLIYIVHPIFIRFYNIISSRIGFLENETYINVLKTLFTIICSSLFVTVYLYIKRIYKENINEN